jgi:hypothetical protein
MTSREDCAPVAEIEDHRATRRIVDLAPSDEEVMARAAEHLARAQYHNERAQELLAPLNRELAYRHEAELAVEEKLSEGES